MYLATQSEAQVDLVPLEQIDSRDYPHINFAKAASEKSKHKFKMGAALVRKNKVLSCECNLDKTHPYYGRGYWKKIHAEAHAIYKARKKFGDLTGSVLYVYRKNWNLAKPCGSCMSLIKQHGIVKVVYTSK